jgi:hypothetical protein
MVDMGSRQHVMGPKMSAIRDVRGEEKNVELVSDLDEKIVRPATALMPTDDEIVYSFVRGT